MVKITVAMITKRSRVAQDILRRIIERLRQGSVDIIIASVSISIIRDRYACFLDRVEENRRRNYIVLWLAKLLSDLIEIRLASVE